MNSIIGRNCWYALHTRSRFEQKVFDGLQGKDIEALLPKVQVMSRRTDRKKKILVPILPGFVFVNFKYNAEEYHHILRTTGVVRMLGFKGKPIPADDQEIASLIILDNTDRTVQNRDYINKGDLVRIMEGPLKDLVGIYEGHKGQQDKVIVSVELLNRSLSVDLEDWALEKV